MSATIYARVSDATKASLDEYAAANALTLSAAVARLIERGAAVEAPAVREARDELMKISGWLRGNHDRVTEAIPTAQRLEALALRL